MGALDLSTDILRRRSCQLKVPDSPKCCRKCRVSDSPNVVESLSVNKLGSGLRAPWIAVNTQLTDGPTPAGLSGRGAWDTALAGLPGRGAPEALSEHEQSGQRFSSKPPSSIRFSLLSLPSYCFPMGEVHPAGPTGIGLTISAHFRIIETRRTRC